MYGGTDAGEKRLFCMQQVEINYKNVDSMVREGKTFLYFTADFSPFAKVMEPVYAQFLKLAENYDVKVCRINVTAQIDLGQRYQIKELPTMLVFRNGMKVDDCPGIVPLVRYENMLKFF